MNETKILEDLFAAYYTARSNKRNTRNALLFEVEMEAKIFELFNEIIERRYKPVAGICFVVSRPVKREVFAADFRDRVIHHFLCNYIVPIFERHFINDTYSCRKGKGTLYGVKRADEFIRRCSADYTRDCYVLKLDIKGYFMSMNRRLLCEKVMAILEEHKQECRFDYELVEYLLKIVIFNDPTKNCKIRGRSSDWSDLPRSKSLFYAREDCGLPIGNLTSQLFGNVYLNDFDHFVKDELGMEYYGRYVDDMIFVHESRERLTEIIPVIREYLSGRNELILHPNKIYLQHYTKGVAFLGAYILPHRRYILNRTKGNFYACMSSFNRLIAERDPLPSEVAAFVSSVNSYLGILLHCSTYKIRRKLLLEQMHPFWWRYVYIRGSMKKVVAMRVGAGSARPIENGGGRTPPVHANMFGEIGRMFLKTGNMFGGAGRGRMPYARTSGEIADMLGNLAYGFDDQYI